MTTAVAERPTEQAQAAKPAAQLPAIRPPRLPYHPAIEERFGIDKASWKALVEAVFPLATTVDAVLLALSYCRARKLDPFKRNVHIVPIWNSDLGKMVDTVWPGIGELRTTAFRTGQYAGRGETAFGADITRKVGTLEITFPEWAQVTVQRLVGGQVVNFTGPRVYWLETYTQAKKNDPTPNSMWAKRTRGQLEKCAEAAALRAAFPEEIGNEHTNDEVGVMQFTSLAPAAIGVTAKDDGRSASDKLADALEGKDDEAQDAEGSTEESPDQTTDELMPVTDEHGQPVRDEFFPGENESDTQHTGRLGKLLNDAGSLDRLATVWIGCQREHGEGRINDEQYATLVRKQKAREKGLREGQLIPQ